MFQSARAQYQDKSSSAIEKSLPKSLFCGKFTLSPEFFQEGIAAGDFQEVDVGGRAQYVWSSRESKITKGDRSEVGLKAEIQGKKEDGAKFDALLGPRASSHTVKPMPIEVLVLVKVNLL